MFFKVVRRGNGFVVLPLDVVGDKDLVLLGCLFDDESVVDAIGEIAEVIGWSLGGFVALPQVYGGSLSVKYVEFSGGDGAERGWGIVGEGKVRGARMKVEVIRGSDHVYGRLSLIGRFNGERSDGSFVLRGEVFRVPVVITDLVGLVRVIQVLNPENYMGMAEDLLRRWSMFKKMVGIADNVFKAYGVEGLVSALGGLGDLNAVVVEVGGVSGSYPFGRGVQGFAKWLVDLLRRRRIRKY